nr:hypothetical protein [Tanacetum cinerariifolium]
MPHLDLSSSPLSGDAFVIHKDSMLNRIYCFLKGTSYGRDGLRAQHLEDSLGGAASTVVDDLLRSITRVINLFLSGMCPSQLGGFIASAPLTPLVKSGGDLCPIAIGIVWRRLVSKVASLAVGNSMNTSLLIESMGNEFRLSMLLVDFKNAFNLVDISVLLQETIETFPSIALWVEFFYSQPVRLYYDDFVLWRYVLPWRRLLPLQDWGLVIGSGGLPLSQSSLVLAIPMFFKGSLCSSCNVHQIDQLGDHVVYYSSEVGVKFKHDLVHDILVDICSKVKIMAIQADCNVKATNIILQGLPPEFYALERECKLYDEFDKFAYKKRETLLVVTSCYLTTNNQLRNLSNPSQQAIINDGRVTLQPVQRRQVSFATGTTRTYTPGASRSNFGKQRTAICYNYKGEGYMSKQCTKPKRK